MPADMQLLLLTAITVALLHTAAGPDHYLPFIALAKSRGWSCATTAGWTVICGLAHVASSVMVGLGGAALGWQLSSVKWAEGIRGGLAGWLLLLFGVVYAAWGLWRGKRNYGHKHFDTYPDGEMYVYHHRHGGPVSPAERHRVTPWVLFIIFILGPCEPMLPLLYFPAARASATGMLLLIIVYTICTLAVMLLLVLAGYYGAGFLKTAWLEKHLHLLSGLTLATCGAGMVFLGW